MDFDFQELRSGKALDAAARAFEEDGYVIVTGLGTTLIDLFKPVIAERLRVDEAEMNNILAPDSPAIVLPEETRQRMSRIDTPLPLAAALFEQLTPILERLTGPFQQISSNFHGQFKGGDSTTTNYGGYHGNTKYLEVHRPYLIHQDFTAGAIPTSPAGLTVWTPLNACPDWTLRLWPGAHRYGMLCRKFPALDDPKLAAFRPHVDVQARPGTAAIFNALLPHATSNPGQRRRLSCDIRFFPLTGFVPSTPRVISSRPMDVIKAGLARDDGPTLKAPLKEALAFLGQGTVDASVPPLGIGNWANYITVLQNDGPEAALPHLVRFVNTKEGWEPPEAYLEALHNRPIHKATVDAVRETELARA
jgi:hypothetical protein